jgi:hypothetical protein
MREDLRASIFWWDGRLFVFNYVVAKVTDLRLWTAAPVSVGFGATV